MKFKKIIPAFFLALVMIATSACSLFGDAGETVTLNLNGGVLEEKFDSYTPGEEKTLPTPDKENYDFAGWYDNEQLTGTAVEKITAEAQGALSFWAKWSPKTFTIEYLNITGATLSKQLQEYTYGTGVILPTAEKEGCDFGGWYTDAGFSGEALTFLSNTASGNKTLYAKWSGKSYKLELVLNNGVLNNAPTSYTYGVETVLPTPTREGYNFSGWYENSSFSGSAVTKINADDAAGDRKFYANWTSKDAIPITAYGGYQEGAYVEFDKINGVSSYKVSYKASGENSYTQIDPQLVRETGTKIRADVVGIKKGTYDIKVEAGAKEAVKNGVTVSEYDRSGYAHFDSDASDKIYADGVGGYKNDGTPKSNAQIIYVSEATKNSVEATINGTKRTGLVAILQALPSSKTPVIIRLLDTVKAATWNQITYTKNQDGTDLTSQYIIKQTKELTGKTLSAKKYTQQELLDGKFNTYNTSEVSVLENLDGYMNYDSGKDEFDSCWNNCSIENANNVTVEGIGTDAGLFQWGMTWKNSNSIEVRNLTFDSYTEDACSFEGSKTTSTNVDSYPCKRIWLHNNTFLVGKNYWDVCKEQDKGDGDGSTDFKYCSYITLSYNHYIKTHKTGLIGGSNSHMTANVTFHHNYYDGCKSRLPLSRQANMHMYNNYYHNADTSVSLRAKAYAFLEYCYFDGNNNTMIDIQGDEGAEGTYGVAKLFNCKMESTKSKDKYTYSKLHANDNTTAKKNLMIVTVTDRAKTVASFNAFCPNFDTNPDKFYYDSTNKKSKVTSLIEDANQIPALIPTLAGVLKAGK